MAQRAPIDWEAFQEAGVRGQFMALLAKLPRERWAERSREGRTLLHYACQGPNVAAVVALLQSGLADVNVRNNVGWTPAMYATWNEQPRVLEILCAAGVNLRAQSSVGNAPLEFALERAKTEGDSTAHVLMANGVRLSTVRGIYFVCVTPELEAFERGVLCCRTAVVAMMRAKKAGNLWRWDKFLLREMAYAVWATRYEREWQN